MREALVSYIPTILVYIHISNYGKVPPRQRDISVLNPGEVSVKLDANAWMTWLTWANPVHNLVCTDPGKVKIHRWGFSGSRNTMVSSELQDSRYLSLGRRIRRFSRAKRPKIEHRYTDLSGHSTYMINLTQFISYLKCLEALYKFILCKMNIFCIFRIQGLAKPRHLPLLPYFSFKVFTTYIIYLQ